MGHRSAAEIDLGLICLLCGGFELAGHCAGAQLAQVRDAVVERPRRDAEPLGDRGDRAARVGQQVTGGPGDLLGGDAGASADPAAGAGDGEALLGADDEGFSTTQGLRRCG